jgi:hypothetical protein
MAESGLGHRYDGAGLTTESNPQGTKEHQAPLTMGGATMKIPDDIQDRAKKLGLTVTYEAEGELDHVPFKVKDSTGDIVQPCGDLEAVQRYLYKLEHPRVGSPKLGGPGA